MTKAPDDRRTDVPNASHLLESARKMLIDALELMDRADAPGQLGARLQHVIDELAPGFPLATRGQKLATC
ncbi:MAG: hypothetical protein ABIW33_07145 [Sphingomicrobium sp.]